MPKPPSDKRVQEAIAVMLATAHIEGKFDALSGSNIYSWAMAVAWARGVPFNANFEEPLRMMMDRLDNLPNRLGDRLKAESMLRMREAINERRADKADDN